MAFYLQFPLLHLGTGGRGGAPRSFLPVPGNEQMHRKRQNWKLPLGGKVLLSPQPAALIYILYIFFSLNAGQTFWRWPTDTDLCHQSWRACWGRSSGRACRAQEEGSPTRGGRWSETPTHLSETQCFAKWQTRNSKKPKNWCWLVFFSYVTS